MPRHLSVKILFTMRGFYLGEGPIFASEDRLKPRRLLHIIIGVQLTDGRITAAKNAIAAAFCKLFELASELKELFIALRGHRSFFETLAPHWNEQIHDKVSVDDLIMLVNFWTMARRNHRGAASARFKMSDLVDEWIEVVDTMEGLEPLTTATVVVAGQPNTVAGVTAELESVAFGDRANTANELSEPWPPAHFQGSDKAYLIDNKVKHKLQGINAVFFGASGPPELPNKRTALVKIKLFVAYWALRNTKPDNLWSLFVVPVGPFWSATDRDQWNSLTGNCSKDLSTLNGLVRRTKIAFGGGKSTMIALLALWMGSVEQVEAAASASNIVDNPTKIWSQKCPRQGIAIALRKITVDGEQKMDWRRDGFVEMN
ncbi:hypothetical protein F5X68DRAFT_187002 [Plectosphaerella plurivora]|uniref:Uncharacterized protein n=1 Tax=Plectosphaerella plurivora TaxID=936078 RepID=A0A9P8VLX1_9PEZI|nr:hypothetical protein F5X68DRAFT_187002 [Plectosphaerella plurivora]